MALDAGDHGEALDLAERFLRRVAESHTDRIAAWSDRTMQPLSSLIVPPGDAGLGSEFYLRH